MQDANISDDHINKVETIQKQVEGFYRRKEKVRIFHGNTNTTRSQYKDPKNLIDLSHLNAILEINVDERYMIVEPNVSMEALVDAALEYSLTPLVIPEFPSITAGGAVQGGAAESSSFKYGGFSDGCVEYEVILGNGIKVNVSKTQNADLFEGIPSSYGTVGIITLLKINLTPATPEIHLKYHKVTTYKQAVALVKKLSNDTNLDFIDGIMFSKDLGVIMEGAFGPAESLAQSTLHKSTDDWFYLHALNRIKHSETYEERLPTKDYLFRYDRGAFWVAKHGFSMFHVPFNRFSRWWFSSLFPTKRLYKFLHGARMSQSYLVQDICLPNKQVISFMEYNQENFDIWPLWLCPIKVTHEEYMSPNYLNTDLVINVGIWGKLDVKYQRFVERNQSFEAKVESLGGRKVLYAHAYYSEADFWDIYDFKRYTKLRNKYNAEVTYPDIYNKTHVAEEYSPSVLRGLKYLLFK